MNHSLEYWKKRCELAEAFIEESPCDPDITVMQDRAYQDWQDFKNSAKAGIEPEEELVKITGLPPLVFGLKYSDELGKAIGESLLREELPFCHGAIRTQVIWPKLLKFPEWDKDLMKPRGLLPNCPACGEKELLMRSENEIECYVCGFTQQKEE